MKRQAILTALTVLTIASVANAGIKRIDISPSALINLNDGHQGEFLGGAVTGDFYMSGPFAIRTTLGFTKNRFFPSDADFSQADYDFWVSVAPYVEANIGGHIRPYLAILGSFGTSNNLGRFNRGVPGFEQAPVNQFSNGGLSSASYYSFGLSLGSKVHVEGPVSIFAEVTHYFYSNTFDSEDFFSAESSFLGRTLDFERDPTYISMGLSYSFDLSKKKK